MAYRLLVPIDKGATDDAGMCLRFVQRMFGGVVPYYYKSAWIAWENTIFRHSASEPVPDDVPSVLWFSHYGTYGSPPEYANWGHATVHVPGDAIYSSPYGGHGQVRVGTISEIERAFNCKYVGWSEDVGGLRVIEPVPDQAVGPMQRIAGPNGVFRRAAPSTQAERLGDDLEQGTIGNFVGYVHGEPVSGNDIWFVGIRGHYWWSGAFIDSGTHDLPDLTPSQEPSTPTEPEKQQTESTPVDPEIETETPVTDTTEAKTETSTEKQKPYNVLTPEQWAKITAETSAGDDPKEAGKYDLISGGFWNYAGERVIKTFAQSFASVLTLSGAAVITNPNAANILGEIGWGYIASVAVVTSLYSLLTALAGFKNIYTPKKKAK